MSAWAKPGAKCVCINDSFRDDFADDIERPVAGRLYTVRDAFVKRGKPQILLVEIRNHVGDYKSGRGEASFHPNRFRPLITRTQEQDVAIFRPLLEPERVGA